MARLAIYNGKAFDREVVLPPRTLRIGRSDQNDIVLTDAAKAVSRFHAELRFENGEYSIADLGSQNGTWVSGKRVEHATLAPGTPVVLGTFRLVIRPDVRPESHPERMTPASPPSASKPASWAPGETDASPQAPTPPVPVESAAHGAGSNAPWVPAAVSPSPGGAAPRPVAPGSAPPPPAAAREIAPPPAPRQTPVSPAPPVRLPRRMVVTGGRRRVALFVGVFAGLALASLAAGVFWWPRSPAAPPSQTAAKAGDAEEVPGGPPTATPLAPQPADGTAAAGAAPAAAGAPAVGGPSEPARQAAPAEPVAAPPAPKGARKTAAPRAPAARGASSRFSPAQVLEEARSAVNRGDYPTAIARIESVLKADPKNPEASALLASARGAARSAAQESVDAGRRAEAAGDLAGAARAYERAQQLDPTAAAPADALRGVRERMRMEGEDAFKRGRQFDAVGRTAEAVAMYEKVVKLLPPDHPSAVAARERLSVLRSPGP